MNGLIWEELVYLPSLEPVNTETCCDTWHTFYSPGIKKWARCFLRNVPPPAKHPLFLWTLLLHQRQEEEAECLIVCRNQTPIRTATPPIMNDIRRIERRDKWMFGCRILSCYVEEHWAVMVGFDDPRRRGQLILFSQLKAPRELVHSGEQWPTQGAETFALFSGCTNNGKYL